MAFAPLKLFSPPLDIEGLVWRSRADGCAPAQARRPDEERLACALYTTAVRHYEVIDFLAVLFGYAISGERTLEAFYERLQPFAVPFMALFERDQLPRFGPKKPGCDCFV